MANNKKPNKKINSKMRVIILTFVGIGAFVVSVGMNIVGMKNAINKSPDSSGMAGFSVRNNKFESLESKKEEKNIVKIEEQDILINCIPLIKLNNNGWDRMKSNFSEFELDENEVATFEDGYKLYCNGSVVNYIIFDNTYEKEVIGNLKVGTDFKTIKNQLGTPTFKTSQYLGYKTREVYVFFYKDKIVVYPNSAPSNKKLEELLNSYLEKEYGKGRTYFLVDIRENYKDFIIEMDDKDDVVTITSLLRQVKAKLDSIGNIEIELYNGYNVANEDTKELINEKRYLENEKDLVEIFENERVSGN